MVRLQIFKIEDYQAGRTHPDCLICLTLFIVKSTEKGKTGCPRVHDGRKEVKTLEARLTGSNPGSFTTGLSHLGKSFHLSIPHSFHLLTGGNNSINFTRLL